MNSGTRSGKEVYAAGRTIKREEGRATLIWDNFREGPDKGSLGDL